MYTTDQFADRLKKLIPRTLGTNILFWSIALSGIAGLLVAVAVLQYRWTSEATSAEEMRIGAELESQMMKWHGDFYGEFSAICVAMQVGPDSGARDTWGDYLDRYVEWNYALPHESLPNVYRNPDIVRDVYVWETNLQSQPRLLLMNLDKKRLEASPVPADMAPLLARLKDSSGSLSKALHAWQLPGAEHEDRFEVNTAVAPLSAVNNNIAGWQFDERVPAIVHPILHHGPGKSLSGRSPVDWIVITIDLSVLQGRILPELSTRYFGGLDGLDYRVGLITTGKAPRTIYSSDIGFGAPNVAAADSTMNIFGSSAGGSEASFRPGGKKIHSLLSTEWRSFSGPTWFPVFEYESQPDPWVLELEHRSGPLQVVITRVWHKYLAMSGLVLLLLVVNITILTVAGFKAQKFARLQMDFVASISHELRTPLTAIFSAGENIKDGIVADRAGLRHYGTLILSQARQLIGHVDRILIFASIRSGKDRYNLRPLDIAEVLRCVRNSVSALIREEAYAMEEYVEPDLPLVEADLLAVCSCLENLITNAIKYGRVDRRIQIYAMRAPPSSGRQEVAITVEDHGMGIKASELTNIFEPFYRSSEAIAAQIHGTGLGLSLAKHLAKSMGGSLSVSSELGVGSAFTLRLSVAREQNRELSPANLGCQYGGQDE